MTAAANNFARLADDLGLVAEKESLLIGKIRGFPVGVKCIDPDGSGLLLFQIRHPLPAGAKELSSIQNTSEIERLVAEKKIEISLEDKVAWLTFVEGGGFHLAIKLLAAALSVTLAVVMAKPAKLKLNL